MENFLQLANSVDSNGEYLFAGYQSLTKPLTHDGAGGFTYNGDTGQRMVKIGDSREVAMNDPGSSIFMGIAAAAGGRPTSARCCTTSPQTWRRAMAIRNAIADIDTAFSSLFNTRAKIGARMTAIDDQKNANESFDLAVADVRSSLEDLDYAEAISRFNQQLTALQASQQSFLKIQDMSLFNFLR